jgi:Zn-dependent protease with chaperone function
VVVTTSLVGDPTIFFSGKRGGTEIETAYPAVPGPVDRESFRDSQKRHRRASWRFTALSALGIVVMGVSLSAIISPLIYALAFVMNDIVNFFVPTPDLFREITQQNTVPAGTPTSPLLVAVLIAMLLLPGALVLLLSWIGVRSLFRRAGSGGTVLALGAREPQGGILEEQQIVNVVAEMAIAAGVPPPQVKLLDSEVPNAVAVGKSFDDATVVVTTGLLKNLNRDQTQAVVGHVVGSVGNGDLKIGMTIASLFQTLGMVSTFLRAPTEKPARKNLRRLLKFVVRRERSGNEAAAVADMLAEAADEMDTTQQSDKTRFRDLITLPVYMASAAFTMNDFIFMSFLINPFLKRAWLARQYLADATAVELTRNPQALATAVVALSSGTTRLPGTGWAGHLFVVGPHTPQSSGPTLVGFHAPPDRRVERLERLGADVEFPSRIRPSRRHRVILITFLVLTSPLWIGFFLLMFGLALALTGISLMIDMLFLFPLVALLHYFLRLWAG